MSFFAFLSKLLGGNIGRKQVSVQTQKVIETEWSSIKTLMAGRSPSQLKQALISADKSLDAALKDVVAGETMGERLKNAKDKFPWEQYQKIWNAHKMRNALVHEAGYDPSHFMITDAIKQFQDALRSLGVRV